MSDSAALYKIVIKKRMGIEGGDPALFETQSMYIRSTKSPMESGSLLVGYLEKRCGGIYNKDFFIKFIENLGYLDDLK